MTSECWPLVFDVTPIVGNALVGPASHVQNNSPDHGRVKVCHLSQNFSTQITSREYFSVFWTDLHPNGPSWGLIEHLGCQSLKERFFRDTLYDWGILHLSFLHCLWWPFSQRVKEYLFLYLRASLGVMVYVTRQNWAKSSSISVSFFGLWRFSHISEWRPIVGILPLPSHGDDVPTGSRAWELSLLLCWLGKPISDPNIIFLFIRTLSSLLPTRQMLADLYPPIEGF